MSPALFLRGILIGLSIAAPLRWVNRISGAVIAAFGVAAILSLRYRS